MMTITLASERYCLAVNAKSHCNQMARSVSNYHEAGRRYAMIIGYPSVVILEICLVLLLIISAAHGIAAVKRFRLRDKYGMWQGIFGALGFGLLPYSMMLGPFQILVVLLVVAASMMGLRGHIG
jgi:hypothetical protein